MVYYTIAYKSPVLHRWWNGERLTYISWPWLWYKVTKVTSQAIFLMNCLWIFFELPCEMSQGGSFLKKIYGYGLIWSFQFCSLGLWNSEPLHEIIDMIDEPLHVHSIKKVFCEGQSGAKNTYPLNVWAFLKQTKAYLMVFSKTNIAPGRRASPKETHLPTIHFQVLC